MQIAIFTGNLTRDPETRYTAEGTAISKYTVAVNRRYIPKDGVSADFFDVTTFGKQAENDAKFLSKGNKVEIHATIQLGSYTDKDGNNHKTIDFLPSAVQYLSPKK